jgi:hypothetical protein
MATNVVESFNLTIFAQDEEDGEAGHFEGPIIARFCELAAVRKVQPRL